MLRWRTVNRSFSSIMIDLRSCPCFLGHWILRLTWLSITVASTFSLLICSSLVAHNLFDEMSLRLLLSLLSLWWVIFCASRDCKCCSSIFTKSIAPPTIDAWSPCGNYNKISLGNSTFSKGWNFNVWFLFIPFGCRKVEWWSGVSWDERSFGVCGFVQPQCVSFFESPSLLCFSLV